MNRNLAWKLNWYRQSELEGSLLLGRMVGLTDDAHLAARLTPHCSEEAEHSLLWKEAIAQCGLPHIRIFRSYQSFYLAHTGPPASLLEVLAFTQIFERRVHLRFIAEAADPGTPSPARRAFLRMVEDEKDHLAWVAQWLRGQSAAAATLRHYEEIDRQVFTELQPYEEHLYDIPGLGREHASASREPHTPHA